MNVCEDRVEQSVTVQVKVKDMRGSRGSVWRRCVCAREELDACGWESWDEVGGEGGEDSFKLVLLDVAGCDRLGEVVLKASTPGLSRNCTDADARSDGWGFMRLRRGGARPILRNKRDGNIIEYY